MSEGQKVAAGAGLWLLAAVALIQLGVADGELVCDDAYYYFEIARNAALGQGFTFDSLRPTNGFHPLWAWLLVPLYALMPDSPWGPIRAGLMLSALFTALTALCLWHFFARREQPLAGRLAAWVWLFNPFSAVLMLRGVEGPLNTLVIALTLLQVDGLRLVGRLDNRALLRLGVCVGLCLLARTDNVLFVAALAMVLTADLLRTGRAAQIPRVGAVTGGIIAAVISPWVLWNFATFGSVVQTSFRAKQLFALYGQLPPLVPPGDSLFSAPLNAVANLGRVAQYNARYVLGQEWSPHASGLMVLVPLALLLLALALAPRLSGERSRYQALGASLVPAGVFVAVHFVWYAWVSRNYYNWYFLPPVLVFALFAGKRLAFTASLLRRLPSVGVAATVLGLTLATPAALALHVAGESRPHQDERAYLEGYGAKLAQLPEGARAGIWNAGQVGYFASFHHPDKRVVNLDGVVNNAVPRRAALGEYEQLLLEELDYLIEAPSMMVGIVGLERAQRFTADHVYADGRLAP